MLFSYSTVINTTLVCGILCIILYFYQLNNRNIIRLGTSFFIVISLVIMVRYMLPFEFPFTRTINVYDIYPEIYMFFYRDRIHIGNFEISCFDCLGVIGLVGVFVFVLRSVFVYVELLRTFKTYTSVTDRHLIDLFNSSKDALGIKKDIVLKLSPDVYTPMIFGIRHTYISIPNEELSDSEWKFIFSHELTHYRKKHLLLKILFEVLHDIYWWNPVIYMFRKLLENILEMSVDTYVASRLNDISKIDYLLCLTRIARLRIVNKKVYSMANAFVPQNKSYLSRRINLVEANMDNPQKPTYDFKGYLTALLMAATLIGSLLFIIEPSRRIEEVLDNYNTIECFTFDEPGNFLVEENGKYYIYLNYERLDLQPWSTVIDPDARVYSSYEEALEFEK